MPDAAEFHPSMSRVGFDCPTTMEPIGLPLTANSAEEAALMSFPGVEIDECPKCGLAP
jgi:hypothetical protein